MKEVYGKYQSMLGLDDESVKHNKPTNVVSTLVEKKKDLLPVFEKTINTNWTEHPDVKRLADALRSKVSVNDGKHAKHHKKDHVHGHGPHCHDKPNAKAAELIQRYDAKVNAIGAEKIQETQRQAQAAQKQAEEVRRQQETQRQAMETARQAAEAASLQKEKEAQDALKRAVDASRADEAKRQQEVLELKAVEAKSLAEAEALRAKGFETELTKTKGELQETKGTLERAKAELESKRDELVRTKGELAVTKDDLAATQRALAAANESIAALAAALYRVRGELAVTKEDLAQARRALEEAQVIIRAVGQKLAETKRMLIGVTKERDSARQEAGVLKGELIDERMAHAATAGTLAREVRAHNATKEVLRDRRAEVRELNRQVDNADQDLEDAEGEIAAIRRRAEEAEAQAAALQAQLRAAELRRRTRGTGVLRSGAELKKPE